MNITQYDKYYQIYFNMTKYVVTKYFLIWPSILIRQTTSISPGSSKTIFFTDYKCTIHFNWVLDGVNLHRHCKQQSHLAVHFLKLRQRAQLQEEEWIQRPLCCCQSTFVLEKVSQDILNFRFQVFQKDETLPYPALLAEGSASLRGVQFLRVPE